MAGARAGDAVVKITNEISVAVPADETFHALLDVRRVAQAIPGTWIDEQPSGGVYRGGITVKLGPVTAEYEGVVELLEDDEDERVAVFRAEGREKRGQGAARAVVTNRVVPEDGRARVVRLTARGRALDQAVRDAAQAVDDNWRRKIGDDQWTLFRAVLARIAEPWPPDP